MDLAATLAALGVPAQYVVLILAVVGIASALMPWLPVPKSATGRIAWGAARARSLSVARTALAPAGKWQVTQVTPRARAKSSGSLSGVLSGA